jgi:hypothetical protein
VQKAAGFSGKAGGQSINGTSGDCLTYYDNGKNSHCNRRRQTFARLDFGKTVGKLLFYAPQPCTDTLMQKWGVGFATAPAMQICAAFSQAKSFRHIAIASEEN